MGQKSPLWFPDGKNIVCTGYSGYGIWMVPAEGGPAKLIYNNCHRQEGYVWKGEKFGGGFMQPLCFTPDGKEITFADYILDPARGSFIEENATGISVYHPIPVIRNVNIETGQVRTVVEEVTDGSWSPDGKSFVYAWQGVGSDFGKKWGVKVLNITTGESTLLVEGGYSPSFTPDGKYVLYTSITNSEDYLSINIFRIPATGGTPEQITFFSKNTDVYNASDAICSPDGEWILFTASYPDAPEVRFRGLCAMNLKTGESFKAFPRAELTSGKAKWSPDGKKFVYMVGEELNGKNGQIFTVTFQPTPFWKPTAVMEKAPVNFSIRNNYPNPFNPSTTIEFSLPENGFARLEIYDISGQKVRELFVGQIDAGSHTAFWDGRDSAGTSVSSGVYLSRLSFGNRIAVRKMTLIR
jgi:Tol biopolymer transport system component